jgi:uncharacterized protein (TIGR02466 family)
MGLTSWLNVHETMGYNAVHSHPGALISGVIYLSCPEGSGKLHLRDPRLGATASKSKLLLDIGQEAVITPIEGFSILFPSYLEHWVEPSTCKETTHRISIAFNIHEFT